ncbi:MAG: glycosyltransferase, partial [Sphingobacteriaceae bacterium]
MKLVNLSYIICTYNRLPFLQLLLPRLIDALQDTEEIIVIDGDSTDGSKDYL